MAKEGKLPKQSPKNEQQPVVQTPANQGIVGGVDKMVTDLDLKDMAAAYAIIFGNNTSSKTWKDITNNLKGDKSLFGKIEALSDSVTNNSSKILKEMQKISAAVNKNQFDVMYLKDINDTLDKLLKSIHEEEPAQPSQLATIALSVSQDSASAVALLIDSMASVDDKSIKSLQKLLSILDNLNNSSLADIQNISSLTNALMAIKNLNDIADALKTLSNSLDDATAESIKTNIASLKSILDKKSKDDIASLLESISEIKPAEMEKPLKEMLAPINDITETIKTTFNEDYAPFSKNAKALAGSIDKLIEVFDSLKKIKPIESKQPMKKVLAPLDDVVDTMKNAFSTDYSKLGKNADTLLKSLNKLIDIIKELPKFDSDKSFGALSKEIKSDFTKFDKNMADALEAQQKGMASTEALIGNASKMEDLIDEVSEHAKKANDKSTTVAINGMAQLVFSLGTMVIIGSLIAESHPNFIKDAFKFGTALVAFTVLTLAPILLINKIYSKQNQIAIEGFAGMILAIGGVLIIGSLIYEKFGPNFSKYVKQFVIDFTLFMLGISLSLALVKAAVAEEKTVFSLSKLVTRCAIVMFIGAFFIMAQGGALVKASLMFGLTLGLFILCVTLPLTLMASRMKGAMESLADVSRLILTCAIVMLLGALVVRNKKLWMDALKFGLLLGAFILLVLAPIWLMSGRLKESMDAIKRISGLIVIATVVLMLGGWFMSNKKLADGALKFAMLVVAFIGLVAIGIGIATKHIGKNAVKMLYELNRTIVIVALTLMLGGLFMTDKELATGAVKFALLVVAFTVLMVLALKYVSKNFNKKVAASVNDMMLTIVLLSLVLMLGSMIIDKFGFSNAILFAVSVALFIVLIASALLVMNKMFSKMENVYGFTMEFAAAVAILGLILMLGAIIISEVGFMNAVMFAVCLAVFVGIMAVVFTIMSNFADKIMSGTQIAKDMAVAIGLLGISLFIVSVAMKRLKIEDLILFLGAVVILAAVFGVIGIPYVAMVVGLGSIVATAMGVALMSLSIGLMLVCVLSKLPIKEGAQKLSEGILALIETFELMGLLMPLIVLGSVAGTLLGASLITLSIGFTMLAALSMIKIDEKEIPIVEAAGKLSDGILALMETFTLMGLLMPLIVLGSVAGVVLSASILTLTVAFTALALATRIKINGQEISLVQAADDLGDGITHLLVPFTILGLPTTILVFTLASVSAALLTASLIGLSLAFSLLKAAVNDKTVENVGIFRAALLGSDGQPGLVDIICKIVKPKTLLKITAGKHIALATASSIHAVSKALKAMHEAISSGDILTEIATFTQVIEHLMNTFDSSKDESPFKNINFGSILWTTWMIKMAIHPMIKLSADLFAVVKDFATLMIPDEWNKEGKAIHYKQLKQSDFKDAAESITSSIEALLNGFAKISENTAIQDMLADLDSGGGISGFFGRMFRGEKQKSWLGGVLKVTGTISQVMSQVGDNIISFATLMIPDDWNKEGKAIHYRQLGPTDFKNAAQGIVTLLDTTMKGIMLFGIDYKDVIDDFANNDSGWLGLRKGKSRFSQILSVAGKVGEFVSGMAAGIKDYATLQIPDDWNKEGKPIHFRQLKEDDFIAVKANIQHIICGVTDAIRDAKWIWPSKVDNISEAVTKVSKMLSDVAKVIVDYSSLRIPVFRPGKLEPDTYRTLTNKDFEEFGDNVGDILAAIPAALMKGVNAVWALGTTTDYIKWYSDNLMPMTQLLANVVNAIKAYASLKKMPIMDKDGKIASYIEIDLNKDLSTMGDNVGKIITGMADAIIKGYNALNDGKNRTASEIEKIISSIKPMGDLLKTLIDSVQAYANLKIPKYNNKGEINGYVTLIDDKNGGFDALFTSIETNISKMLNGLIVAVKGAIDKNKWLNKDDERRALTKKLETINEIFNPVNNLIKLVQDYANLKIPTKFDSTGKPIRFEKIESFDTEKFKTTIGTIMGAIPEAVKEGIKVAQPHLNAVLQGNETFSKFQNDYDKIVSFIGKDIFPAFQSFVEFKVPIEFDKDGKPKKYFKLDQKTIANLETTISSIICSAPNAMHKAVENLQFNNDDYLSISKMQQLVTDSTKLLDTVYSFDRILDFSNLNHDASKINNLFSSLERQTLFTTIILDNFCGDIRHAFNTIDKDFVHGRFSAERRERIVFETVLMMTHLDEMLDNIVNFGNLRNNRRKNLFDFSGLTSGFEKYNDKIEGFAQITRSLAKSTSALVYVYENLNKIGDGSAAENATHLFTEIADGADNITFYHISKIHGEARALDEYVKAVNKIEVRKVDAMAKMFDSMNKFSASVGNLRLFTNVLARKIAVVLVELKDEMERAELTIYNSNKIRKDREKTMEKTLDKIQTIMKQTLNVNVSSSSGDSISGSQTFGETN